MTEPQLTMARNAGMPSGWADRFTRFLQRHWLAMLAILTVCYCVGTSLRARSAPLWHDEVYTVLMGRMDLPHIWAAAREGVDANPPLPHMLVGLVDRFWGEGNIVSRIPAMAGFWVFCLCLFEFARRRLEISYAFAALLLPISTGAYAYAIQARSYGIALGLCGIALLSWQIASEGRRRRATALAVMAMSLAAAMLAHYYTVLLFLSLGAGELWRIRRSKRIDLPMWGALFAGGFVGSALCYPLLAGISRFRGHPWAVPHLSGVYGFYLDMLQPLAGVMVIFAVLSGCWVITRRPVVHVARARWTVPEHELIALIVLFLLPLPGFALALSVTRMFTDRYFLWAVGGAVLLTVLTVGLWTRRSRESGILLLFSAALPAAWLMGHHMPLIPVADSEPLLAGAIREGPVVMDDGIHFLEQWYYLPPALKKRVTYVADPDSDTRWVGHDTVDVGMLGLRRWFGVPALDYSEVDRPGNTFRIYHNASGPNWLMNRLLQDGARIELLETSGDRELLRATVPLR